MRGIGLMGLLWVDFFGGEVGVVLDGVVVIEVVVDADLIGAEHFFP